MKLYPLKNLALNVLTDFHQFKKQYLAGKSSCYKISHYQVNELQNKASIVAVQALTSVKPSKLILENSIQPSSMDYYEYCTTKIRAKNEHQQ